MTITPHRSWAKDLDAATLYELLKLRVEVFVVEQATPYPELDGRDLLAETRHFWLEDSDGDQILGDVEDFARRNPWAVALGGLALGFAASRVLRASSGDRYQSSAYGSRRPGYAGQLPSPGTAPYGAGRSYPEPPVAATPPVGGTLGPERL